MCRNPRSTEVFRFRFISLQAEKTLFGWAEILVPVFCKNGQNWPQSRSWSGLRRLDGIRLLISENYLPEITIWK